ncbi:MAG: hypothetical protein Ct9H300mP14_10090 [Gammaproteobacteria bacterium]|nr:MAG: hypothetical protein Ct9H300mP14_10090 [Gammaproteobacteria bacterium]
MSDRCRCRLDGNEGLPVVGSLPVESEKLRRTAIFCPRTASWLQLQSDLYRLTGSDPHQRNSLTLCSAPAMALTASLTIAEAIGGLAAHRCASRVRPRLIYRVPPID